MQFRHLRYFVKIVEAGSFSRAAALIHIAQPALSKQIAELEDEFGVVLLHRSARGVTPTAAGEVLYRESVKLIRQVDDLPAVVRSSQGDIQGVVCFGMASTMAPALTGRMLEICRSAMPKVTLRFVTGDSQTLREKVAVQAIDLAIVFESTPETGFAREALFRQRLYLASCGTGEASGKSTSLAAISRLPLMLPTPSNVLRRALDIELAAAGLQVEPVAESDLFDVVLSGVETGLGHAVLPKGDFSDMPGHPIITTPIEPPIYLNACLISARDKPMTRAAAAVGSQLTNFIRSQVANAALKGAEWIGEEP